MTANRGKYAERKVQEHLKELEKENANFTFNRIPDAHAAGGRAQAQAGDFQAFRKIPLAAGAIDLGPAGVLAAPGASPLAFSRNWIIEVKEVAHDYRLPHKNYSEDKVARTRVRALAGSEPIVLVYHTAIKAWRLVPFDVFLTRTGGSWDLRPYPLVTYWEALNQQMGFA